MTAPSPSQLRALLQRSLALLDAAAAEGWHPIGHEDPARVCMDAMAASGAETVDGAIEALTPKRGKGGGRPKGAKSGKTEEILRRIDAGEMGSQIARDLGVARQTVSQARRRYRATSVRTRRAGKAIDTRPASPIPSPASLLDSSPPARSERRGPDADLIERTDTVSARSIQPPSP